MAKLPRRTGVLNHVLARPALPASFVVFGMLIAGTATWMSASADQPKNTTLDAWKYPDAKGWGATTRKHMHSAFGVTTDSLEKVLAFYKEKMESAKQGTRDLEGTDSSSGSKSYTHAEGATPDEFGWVLLRTSERSIYVYFTRGSGGKVTHISLTVDEH